MGRRLERPLSKGQISTGSTCTVPGSGQYHVSNTVQYCTAYASHVPIGWRTVGCVVVDDIYIGRPSSEFVIFWVFNYAWHHDNAYPTIYNNNEVWLKFIRYEHSYLFLFYLYIKVYIYTTIFCIGGFWFHPFYVWRVLILPFLWHTYGGFSYGFIFSCLR